MSKKKNIFLIGILLIFVVIVFIQAIKLWQNRRLFIAIEEQNKEDVLKAINLGADVNSSKYLFALKELVWHNPTPLILACKEGNQEIIEILIENGADVNKCDDWAKQAPLEYSLASESKNRFEIAMYLIENGANYKSYSGTYSPIERAVIIFDSDDEGTIMQGFELFEFLIQNVDEIETAYGIHTLLTFASGNNNKMAVEYLIKNQYSKVDEKNENGMTGLMVAAKNNARDACQKLLELGADITIEDSEGKTAYDYAIENGSEDIASLLK